MKSLLRVIACSTLMLHGTVLATAPWQVADIYSALKFDSTPREYTLELYTENDATQTIVRTRGIMEGVGEWYKAKATTEVVMHEPGRQTTTRFQTRMFQENTYLRINAMDVTEGGITHSMLNPDREGMWIQIHNTDNVKSYLQSDMIIDGIIGNTSPTPDAFTLNSTKIRSGYTHELTMKPEMHSAFSALYEALGADITTLRMKVDTDSQGAFHYGRVYATGAGWSLQIDTQNYGASVYLEVPTQTITMAEYDMPEMHETKNTSQLRNTELLHDVYQSQSQSVHRSVPRSTLRTQQFTLPTIPGQSWSEIRNRYENRRYNEVSDDFEQAAKWNNVHKLKTFIHKDVLQKDSAKAVERWLKNDVLPFFEPVALEQPSIVHGVYESVDTEGRTQGAMVHKSIRTTNGSWKHYLVLLRDQAHRRPGVVDFIQNTKPSELDVSVTHAALDIPISSSLYANPTEDYYLHFDNRGWREDPVIINAEDTLIYYLLPSQTIDDADEIVSTYRISGRTNKYTLNEATIGTHIAVMNECKNVEWSILDEESTPSNVVLFEWTGLCADEFRHEIGSIIIGETATYVSKYTVYGDAMYDGLRTVWLENLKNARVVQRR